MAQIRCKLYSDGQQSMLVCEHDLWGGCSAAPQSTEYRYDMSADQRAAKDADNRDRAMRRARTEVRDLCLCSQMEYFVTLTMSGDKINRYDTTEVVRKTRKWLDNQVYRGGLVAYVMIPERHRDGALHWHGMWRLGTIRPVDSGTISGIYSKPARPRSDKQRQDWLGKGGHIVYNMPAWGYGYSTAIQLYGSYDAAVAYTCKYLSKGQDKIGGRWYYSGGALERPQLQYITISQEEYHAIEGMAGVERIKIKQTGMEFIGLK